MSELKHIPLIKTDVPPFDEIKDQFAEVIGNGRLTNFGKYVTEFERLAGEYLGAHALTTSSGTAGLILTLQALGLSRGAKVILPSFTFVATAQAILYAGAVPVFAEIEEDLTLSPNDLDDLLQKNPDTEFVLPVHMYGLPCHIDEISGIVEQCSKRRGKKIRVIYDAAHAFGSSIGGKRIGPFGDAEVFSLSVTKALTTVEGGLVTSRDEALIQKMRSFRNYGLPPGTYNAFYPGLNSKMSELHAIIGIENLKKLPRVLEERAKKAAYLKREITQKTGLLLVPQPDEIGHTYKDFTVIVPPSFKNKRTAIMEFLKQHGIETRAYFYPAAHEQDFFKSLSTRPLPLTEDLSRRVISLPFFTTITTDEMDYLVHVLKQAMETLK